MGRERNVIVTPLVEMAICLLNVLVYVLKATKYPAHRTLTRCNGLPRKSFYIFPGEFVSSVNRRRL
jgi:hypothetical protein